MYYRELTLDEQDLIKMIDATNFIKNVWRQVDGKYTLVEINWTDYELPNGLPWHMDRYAQTFEEGGKAFGCFDDSLLVGYATLNRPMFGTTANYVLLDQLFVSKDYRNKGIGKNLFAMCAKQGRAWGADKLYICAGSSENTVAFYNSIPCAPAKEVNQALFEDDPNDIQLEYSLTDNNEKESI